MKRINYILCHLLQEEILTVKREKSLFDRPVLQLDLSEKEYDKIIKSLRQLIRDLPR